MTRTARTKHRGFGQALFDARTAAGVSQEKLAELVRARLPGSRTRATDISRWEAGAVAPSPAFRAALDAVLAELTPRTPRRSLRAVIAEASAARSDR